MINFATIGTGWITTSFINCALATGKYKLISIYSRSQETATTFASKHNITKTHTALDELVADSTIDTIYIASPNSLHYAHAKQCLEAGKHVILEKPATSTSKELDDLFKIAREKSVFFLEAFRHVYEPNFLVLQQALKEERIGKIFGATLSYASRSSRFDNVLAGEVPNIFSLEYSGGCLVDLGVYPISTAIALFGPPQSSAYKPTMLSTGVDGGGFITLNYENFGVSINASKIYTSTAPSEIYGEKGTIILNGVTDIEKVDVVNAKTKGVEGLAGQKVDAKLNMQAEAEQFAKIIVEKDVERAKWLEDVSRGVIRVTESLRKANGIVFAAEK
ncbi:putative oxidoreductase protein [Venturia nashicola]|uniref:Putative oxidoreductase protein n=1 Tax=Venturia nashicola TaxID=86259 RepID=A0A4Z1PAL3_9PEZI|nr:putative oxidoreductase protein [Venturia nashicola]TLD28095.1 putative oxidoreductase protein [Venturia nashicola]